MAVIGTHLVGMVGGLALAIVALTVGVAPVAAGGPVEITFPGASCPQPNGLQGCIDGVEAGSTIHIANEIVNEDIRIRNSIRLVGLSDLRPQLDSIDIERSGPAADIRLRDLRVEGGIWARFDGGSGHRLTIDRVTVQGTVPNTGSGITVQTTVPLDVRLERSSVLRAVNGPDSVQFYAGLDGGTTSFRAVGNRLSQHGSNGGTGFFINAYTGGTHHVALLNNTIWDVGACRCGFAAGIGIAAAGQARMDVDIVGDTIERAAGFGIVLRNDTTGDGFLRADIFDTIVAHVTGKAILRETTTGATTTTVRNGYNAIWRTGSSPTSPFFGPGTRFVDPMFVDRANGRLKLKAASPLIDRGLVCTPGGLADPDAAGNHRLAGRSVDIGAHEHGSVPATGIVLMGDDAPETFGGTPGADIFCGFEEADSIDGKGGADYIDGGPGPDTLIGGGGADQLFGRAGADLLCANDGKGTDRIAGGAAVDRFRADPGDEVGSVEQPAPCSAT